MSKSSKEGNLPISSIKKPEASVAAWAQGKAYTSRKGLQCGIYFFLQRPSDNNAPIIAI